MMTTHTENKLESLTFGNENSVFARQADRHKTLQFMAMLLEPD